MRKDLGSLAGEALGTFAVVFAGTLAIVLDAAGGGLGHLGVSLVFGLVVGAMVYALGHVSGAHLNPAVTAAFWASGRFPGRRVPAYWAAQLAGAAAASLSVAAIAGRAHGLGGTYPAGSTAQAFWLELVLTLLLMLVIMGAAVDARAQGGFAGLAIGATVAFEAAIGGPISGASMNPARSWGPALVSGDWSSQWLYAAAPLLGAVLAALAYDAILAGSAAPARARTEPAR